ncbi:hypothetical protein PUNSTDRAFT_121782 [Punctularia strigosozonata HHB-11173 SS5]|uniref:uncharacterized protein n=1 Tax=Punctularia strigosozonata (strain HHB-11173) TaxID=741275 RepID=UPI0004417995|nr:uncharacterized protein PUNSTDRAFT_121782 [Punctularia strigosozonata HHB-11173 SS5]EIN06639.1 hypothetical protein PUNSTDRAFT_121782 [Punctularia strigosozonata HHB-11173 SS5]
MPSEPPSGSARSRIDISATLRAEVRELEKLIVSYEGALEILSIEQTGRKFLLRSEFPASRMGFPVMFGTQLLEDALDFDTAVLEAAQYPDRGVAICNLARDARLVYNQIRSIHDLNDAIDRHRVALQVCRSDKCDRNATREGLVDALHEHFQRTNDVASLMEEIDLRRKDLTRFPKKSQSRLQALNELSSALWHHYNIQHDATSLTDCIAMRREVLAMISKDHPYYSLSSKRLADTIRAYSALTRDRVGAAKEAISLYRVALDTCPKGHPDRFQILTSLADALAIFRTVDAMDESIRLLREAISLPESVDPLHAPLNLAGALHARCQISGDFAKIEEPISLFRQALLHAPEDEPRRRLALHSLGILLLARFTQTNEEALLFEVVPYLREEMSYYPERDLNRAFCLIRLSQASNGRHQCSGDPAFLDESLELCRQSVDALPDDHPDRPLFLHILADASNRIRERIQPVTSVGRSIS